jgi:hypothetical protein
MRLMSNFAYKDAKGKIIQIPVRYGDMNRQVAQIMMKNSENVVQSAPFIACYIKNMEFARDRLQDPTYVSKMNIRERAYDDQGQEYLNTQGANYTIERLMPTPFNLQFTADIWTTNADQKFQILEQLLVLFNPSMEIQSNTNYIDWTSLSLVELTGMTFSSRSVPQGLEQDIDIATLNFQSPIWLTTPAKVKQLGIITKIITSIFDEPSGTIESGEFANSQDTDYFTGRTPVSIQATTLGDLGLLILDNTAKLIPPASDGSRSVNWYSILDAYPGQFTAGLSQIRLMKPDGNEIVGYISLNPTDDSLMQINFDTDTVPMNTLITDLHNSLPRGTVDAIVNPETFNPRPENSNGSLGWPASDARYLILEDINPRYQEDHYTGAAAWKNRDDSDFHAYANNIIQWDGVKWNVIFNTGSATDSVYITNSRTGVQYRWDGESWMKSYEGVYRAKDWRLVL